MMPEINWGLLQEAGRHLDPGEGVMRPGHIVDDTDLSALRMVLNFVSSELSQRYAEQLSSARPETLSQLAAKALAERDDIHASRRWVPPSDDNEDAAFALIMSSELAEWFPGTPWQVVEIMLWGGQVEAVVVVDDRENDTGDQPHLMVEQRLPVDGPPDGAWHPYFVVKLVGRRDGTWNGAEVQDAAHLGELLAGR